MVRYYGIFVDGRIYGLVSHGMGGDHSFTEVTNAEAEAYMKANGGIAGKTNAAALLHRPRRQSRSGTEPTDTMR